MQLAASFEREELKGSPNLYCAGTGRPVSSVVWEAAERCLGPIPSNPNRTTENCTNKIVGAIPSSPCKTNCARDGD